MTNLRNKKELAAKVLGIGISRVWVDPSKKEEVKKAITREDIKGLIKSGIILYKQKKGVSRGRARHILKQKKKGRRKGVGSRKGKHTARSGKKILWINKIRLYRNLFSDLLERDRITRKTYSHLRQKAKGGFFRSRRHILLYLNENKLWNIKK